VYNYNQIRSVHLENTQKCQASCPMCDRNQNGGALNPHIDLSELTLEDCKQIFEPEFIAQLNVMYMCGNLGDPIVAKETLEVFEYFRQHNPNMWLSMNTNAGARDEAWWEDLAKTIGRKGAVIFSVDGLEDTNHLYRQGVVWENVERSMRAFTQAGGRARWDFLIFEHNQHQVDEAKALSEQLGFERFVAKKTGRFINANSEKKDKHQAVDRKGNKTAELKEPDKKHRNKAVKQMDNVVKKHGSMDAYFDKTPIICKVKDEGNLYVTAEGLAMPCCWTAGRMYKWWHKDPKVEQVWDFIDAAGGKDAINAKKHGLKAVFDTGIFEDIQNSWAKSSVEDGKLKVCAQKCGAEFDPFKEQFK
jgi:MoaA/NifB/PqqE/SkfB family radical SAM enzyme